MGDVQRHLSDEAAQLGKRLYRLQARRSVEIEREAEKVVEVASAKNRLAMKGEMQQHLDNLQNLSQRRSIGLFSDLLTNMVHDVLPKNSDQQVHLDLTTKRHRPNLDIMMQVGDGRFEDIMSGRGGSLTNVVATGLRYITLSRTRNRRFMVLDEPDNWVNVEAVPRFARVISDISRKVGVQTLTITHKDPSLYDARVIELYRDNHGATLARTVREAHEEGFEEEVDKEYGALGRTAMMEDVGIRRMRFRNFMSLRDVEIELSPTMNVIVGEGDIGKSAIFAGISALVHNDCRPGMIHHEADAFSVEVEIESGIVIAVEHRRKGQKKTTYRMETPDGEGGCDIITEDNGNEVPGFIAEALAMSPIDGFNIQLGHQKSPPFMLGADITGSRRAELLSLGRESDYVRRMIALYAEEVKQDNVKVKEGERQLGFIRDALERTEGLGDIEAAIENLAGKASAIEKNRKCLADMADDAALLAQNHQRFHRLSGVEGLSADIEVPDLTGAQFLAGIAEVGGEIGQLRKRIAAMQGIDTLPDTNITSPSPREPGEDMISPLLDAFEKFEKANRDVQQQEQAVTASKKKLDSIVADLGGVCPLCGQGVAHTHFQVNEKEA